MRTRRVRGGGFTIHLPFFLFLFGNSCGCDIGESTPYHGSGERPDRIYCHADGSNCKAKVPKREDNSSCGLCEEVSPTIYATGNMDDSSLYRCEMCFFAQRAALLDDIAADDIASGNVVNSAARCAKKHISQR